MKTVSINRWKHLSTYIMLSFFCIQFQLFLHFCVLVQQSQILPSPLVIQHEKSEEPCSHLPDWCYRTISESKNVPGWGSENYTNTEREKSLRGQKASCKIMLNQKRFQEFSLQ